MMREILLDRDARSFLAYSHASGGAGSPAVAGDHMDPPEGVFETKAPVAARADYEFILEVPPATPH